jgi:adenylate cyclase
LIAGVIGKSLLLYDVWGHTVNVGSRMKSLGEPGEIHARGTERDILADKFTFELRGRIKVKGRGKMQTW